MSIIYSLGVMTGTSCDGADLALLALRKDAGGWKESLVKSASTRFPEKLRSRLREAQKGKISVPEAACLARDYSLWLAGLCEAKLRAWRVPKERVFLAVHGQTVWHQPPVAKELGFSVQLLDSAIVASRTGCTVTSHFRQPDLARSGQGAPLVPYYHWLRAVHGPLASQVPFAIHNIGGIANLTYITKDPQDLIAFDTGPGNALIDLATESATKGKRSFDLNGKLAASQLVKVNWDAIERLAKHPYFKMKPPKSTGRELFNESFLRKIPGSGAALVANATALTAHTMAKAYCDFIFAKKHRLKAIYLAGGGAKNPTLVDLFSTELHRCAQAYTKNYLEVHVLPKSFAPPELLEAIAFARLGLEAMQGKPVSLSAVTGASEDASGAGIFPGSNFQLLIKFFR